MGQVEDLPSILGNFKQLHSILETSNGFISIWVIYKLFMSIYMQL